MQDSVQVYERNVYSNVLAIPVRNINKQMTRERQYRKKKKKKKTHAKLIYRLFFFFHGSLQSARLSVRLSARVRYLLAQVVDVSEMERVGTAKKCDFGSKTESPS